MPYISVSLSLFLLVLMHVQKTRINFTSERYIDEDEDDDNDNLFSLLFFFFCIRPNCVIRQFRVGGAVSLYHVRVSRLYVRVQCTE